MKEVSQALSEGSAASIANTPIPTSTNTIAVEKKL
jgi:hypothetical protein